MPAFSNQLKPHEEPSLRNTERNSLTTEGKDWKTEIMYTQLSTHCKKEGKEGGGGCKTLKGQQFAQLLDLEFFIILL